MQLEDVVTPGLSQAVGLGTGAGVLLPLSHPPPALSSARGLEDAREGGDTAWPPRQGLS